MAAGQNKGSGSDETKLDHIRRLVRDQPDAALAEVTAFLREDPGHRDGLLVAAAALRRLGEDSRAWEAEKEALSASLQQPAVGDAARALNEGRLQAAERLLRPHLAKDPDDPPALRMLAAIARAFQQFDDAVRFLGRALVLAPSYEPARQELADSLVKLSRREEALAQAEILLGTRPEHGPYHELKANILNGMGRYEEAATIYEALLARAPDESMLWISYGHILRTLGRLDDSVAAYRRAITLPGAAGIAWWSLASLQVFRFTDEDVAAMQDAAANAASSVDERLRIQFALGKAFEDREQWERSFDHYALGNRIRRGQLHYDAAEASAIVRRSEALFTREFLDSRKGEGLAAADPIFIVGMQRSGSTLVEQILASHSQIEGTAELPDIPTLAKRLGAKALGEPGSAYPETLAKLSADELEALGREYLERTRVQRDTDRPYFIDKLPNNWAHVGLIHLILPRAKIIDVRRHPLDCCFSNYKQLYAMEQGFAYDLEEMGRYYRDYVEMLRHFDDVLPGRVHRVIYEELVGDAEGGVRRLLDHLGLPFEPGCLRFHENDRAVRTASSEQVRQPINPHGIGRWKPYRQWLRPLEEALGEVLAAYPAVPARNHPVTA